MKGHDSVKSTAEQSLQKLVMTEQSQLGRPGRNQSKCSPRGLYCGLTKLPNQVDYLNAIVQLLYHNDIFRRYMREHLPLGVMHSSMCKLFYQMDMMDLTSADNVHSTLLKLKPQFNKNAKYEAQQLFVALVEIMQQEANQLNNVQCVTPLENKSADQAWDYYSECVNNGRLVTLMMSQMETSIVCLTCRHQCLSWSMSCLVQVNIPDETVSPYEATLRACLNKISVDQTFNAYCVECHKIQKSSKRSFINRFPNLLVIHLPRVSSFVNDNIVVISECIQFGVNSYYLTSAMLVIETKDAPKYWILLKDSHKWTMILDDQVKEVPRWEAKEKLNTFGYLLMYSHVPKTVKSKSENDGNLITDDNKQDTNKIDMYQQWAGKPFGYCGLENHNLTCYANSCLQMLFTLEKVRHSIIEHSKCGHFHQELSTLFVAMQIEANKSITFYGACISPVKFMEKFRSAKPQFRINQMADAQEFLAILLEAIHQEANMANKLSHTEKQVEPKSANEAWNYHLQHVDHSYLSDMFMGQIECSLLCCVCEHSSLSWSFIWQLQVQIPNTQEKAQQKVFTLMNCIEDYTDTEILNNDSAPFCSHCKSSQPAIKDTTILRAPHFLMVHLKRFAPDGSKICVPVVIDERLKLAGQEYGLISVVLHKGNESNHGHNFAIHREGDNQWIVLDDKSVDKGLANSYVKDKLRDNAYVCTYQAIVPNETSDKATKQ